MDFDSIDIKWNSRWNDIGLEKYQGNHNKKYYILEMFAYPSGDLHMGHLRNYVLGDVLFRYKKMKGFDVIHPVGWDAFGLPAEEAAIKRGVAPDSWTMDNISVSSSTLKRMGLLYDWEREVITCRPDYYKWTQWIFLKLYEHGLAYRKESYVNWCPSCNTVLANEQVEQGACWRCKSDVVKKKKEQWFIKITDYARRLLSGLDQLPEWPENVKTMQRNWIGRSEGLLVRFPVENSSESIEIFTTRPDTLFGVTFMAIAPESDILEKLNIPDKYSKDVEEYIEHSLMKTEIERTSTIGDKDGVFTGLYAVNPLNNNKVQIWVADYVLSSYGTGAVMSVPAHDSRDHAFAKKYSIDINPVIKPQDKQWDFDKDAYTEEGILVNSGDFSGLPSDSAIEKISQFVEENQLGKRDVNYRIRDWLVSRQRYWGAPIPMIHCEKCGIVALDESDLPVLLPDSQEIDFIPKGESPLSTSSDFINTTCPQCGGRARRDADTMDTFVDSSWYQLRYVDANNSESIFSKDKADNELPVDMYIGGIEHANGHLIYFRFITKFLKDIGMHNEEEPALKLVNQGMIMDSEGNIMSKSKGNAVPVGPFVKKHGSDLARGTMLFIGPGYKDALWSEDGIKGMHRFIERLEKAAVEYASHFRGNCGPSSDTEKSVYVKLNQTIKQTGEDIEAFEHNTAIASIMELLNLVNQKKEQMRKEFTASVLFTMTRIVSPFLPHIGEELHSLYAPDTESVFLTEWPQYDSEHLAEDTVTVVVQINGKVRAKLDVQPDISENEIYERAISEDNVKKYTDKGTVVKKIYVKKKLLSLVVK
ncbi:MAG: leucine--tRNA ligase [bacterium]